LALLGALAFGPPRDLEPDPPSIVLMVPEQPGDRDERVLATLAANLQDLDFALVAERYDASLDLRSLVEVSQAALERSEALGILWIDLPESPGGDLAIYVVARDSSQIHGRVIAAAPSDSAEPWSEAVAIETLANVAAMAATALSEGRSIELDAPTPEASPDASEIPPDTTIDLEPEPELTLTLEGEVVPVVRPWLRARAGYRGQSYAPTLAWMSGVTLAIGVRPAPRAHVELLADIMVPSRVSTDALELRVQPFPFGVAGGYAWPLPRDWDVELAGRVALEPTRRSATATSTQLALTASPERVVWSASAELDLAFGVRLAPSARLAFGLGLAALLVRRDTVISSGDAQQVVISPSPLRALVWAGFDFDLLWR